MYKASDNLIKNLQIILGKRRIKRFMPMNDDTFYELMEYLLDNYELKYTEIYDELSEAKRSIIDMAIKSFDEMNNNFDDFDFVDFGKRLLENNEKKS